MSLIIPTARWYIPPTQVQKCLQVAKRYIRRMQIHDRPESTSLALPPKTEWDIRLPEDIIRYIIERYLRKVDIRVLAMVSRHFSFICRPLIFREIRINFFIRDCDYRRPATHSKRKARLPQLVSIIETAPEVINLIRIISLENCKLPFLMGEEFGCSYHTFARLDPKEASALYRNCVDSLITLFKYDYPNVTKLNLRDGVHAEGDLANIDQSIIPPHHWEFVKKIGPQITSFSLLMAQYKPEIFSLFPNLSSLQIDNVNVFLPGSAYQSIFSGVRVLVLSDSYPITPLLPNPLVLANILSKFTRCPYLRTLHITPFYLESVENLGRVLPETLTELRLGVSGFSSRDYVVPKHLDLHRLKALLRFCIDIQGLGMAPIQNQLAWIQNTVETLPGTLQHFTILLNVSFCPRKRYKLALTDDIMQHRVNEITFIINGAPVYLRHWQKEYERRQQLDDERAYCDIVVREIKLAFPLLHSAGRLSIRLNPPYLAKNGDDAEDEPAEESTNIRGGGVAVRK